MQHDAFLEALERLLGTDDRAEVERTAVAVLQALCDRLTGDEAWDLLAQLPAPLKKAVTLTQAPMRMTADDFVERIARELAVGPDEARERVRAVFAVLREAVSWGELEDVVVQLDPEYADLLA
jgi:uncharacterized protein (DUF2267 family)